MGMTLAQNRRGLAAQGFLAAPADRGGARGISPQDAPPRIGNFIFKENRPLAQAL